MLIKESFKETEKKLMIILENYLQVILNVKNK